MKFKQINSANNMNILILTPILNGLGGVSSHLNGLKKHWTFNVKYHIYGSNSFKDPYLITALRYPIQYVNFIFKLRRQDVVIINPSFRKMQLIRDGIFLLTSKLFGKKVITLIHGFDETLAESMIQKHNQLFTRVYNRSEFIYVLYSGFKEKLLELGISHPILLTTTKVSNSLIENFDIKIRIGHVENILFLGRVIKNKGIFTTLDAYKIVKEKYPNIKLTVCGDGFEMKEAINYTQRQNIEDVTFVGEVEQTKVAQYYLSSDLYILPTHGEGMATSILEAMAFGLPVISRPVGGVNDFFVNGKMGELIKTTNPEAYAEAIEYYINNPIVVKNISSYNHSYAKQHFLASKVVESIESDIKKYIKL